MTKNNKIKTKRIPANPNTAQARRELAQANNKTRQAHADWIKAEKIAERSNEAVLKLLSELKVTLSEVA